MKGANNIGLVFFFLLLAFSTRAATYYVDILDSGYSPSSQSINVGDSVIWINQDDLFEHTITSTTGAFDSGVIYSGYGYGLTFNATGTYNYYDQFDSFTGSITVNAANTPPTVSITSPANGTVFTAPATFTVSANASDIGGSVASVEFLIGTTSLGTNTGLPYSVTASNIAASNYTLYAIATDNLGAKSTNSVSIIVNAAPVVSITSPTNNTLYALPPTFTIQATATDSDGTITNVQFLAGTTLLGNDISNPYSWTVTQLASGTYTLFAVASDNRGAKTTNSVNIIVNFPPTASIVSPTNGAVFLAPYSGTFEATATDPDGSITSVQFTLNSTLIANLTSAPYNVSVTNLAAGNYSLGLEVVDNRNVHHLPPLRTFRVITNATISSIERISGQARLTITAVSGQNYVIEASTNLPGWTPINTNNTVTGPFSYTDTNSGTFTKRFYRVKSQ